MKLPPILLLLALSLATKAQEIPWVKEKPLVWKDFAETAPESPFTAVTSSYIKFTYDQERVDTGRVFSFKIQCLFNTQQSWLKSGGRGKDLLKHEQLHFDMTELYARKLYAALTTAKYTNNYREEINAIYRQISGELRDMQTKYDTQSQHGREWGFQVIWDQHVQTELDRLPHNY